MEVSDQIRQLWIHLLCEGERHVIREILQLDPNQAKMHNSGTTLLHIASGGRYHEEAELLIASGSDVNAVDVYGETPLHRAASNLDPLSCSVLLKHGAMPTALDKRGRTPTDCARTGDIWADEEDLSQTISLLEEAEAAESYGHMTEAEWLAARSPVELLLWLGAKSKRRRTLRKNGLFAVACGERVKSFMTEAITQRGLELAERMAEGLADEAVGDAYLEEFRASHSTNVPGPQSMAWNVPFYAIHVMLPHRTGQSSEKQAATVSKTCTGVFYGTGDIVRATEETFIQTEFLRDIVGNPFRPVTLDPKWLTATVVLLAREMYESRDFSPMPILADALQDAGCENTDVLDHCRSEGPHVRGCWVIDLLLGKE